MCYIVSHQMYDHAGQINSLALGSVVADTAKDAWRKAHFFWPNQEIDVRPVPLPVGKGKSVLENTFDPTHRQ